MVGVTSTLNRVRRIELLLNELRYERHVRRALLNELVDEIDQLDGASPRKGPAAIAARRLLSAVEAGEPLRDFVGELDHVADLMGGHPRSRASA